MKKIVFSLILCSFYYVKAQVGINTNDPKVTFDVSKNVISNLPDGVLISRLTIEELEDNINLYSDSQNSTLIFITSKLPGSLVSTKNITEPGYYYYSKQTQNEEGIWKPLGGYSGTDPIAIWIRDENQNLIRLGVLSNNINRPSGTEFNITDDGDVSIGTFKAEANSILDVFSNNKGVLFPRLSKEQRDNISLPISDGLMIFNIDENCLNYYDNNWSNWRSVCGTLPTAKLNLVSCTQPNQITLTQGTVVNDNDNYIVKVNVVDAGNYSITAKTTNGYSYSKSGTFNQSGTYDVYLDGQGVPALGNRDDSVVILFNGVSVTPNTACSNIHVNNSSITYNLDCSTISTNGTYKKGANVTSDNYINITIDVTSPGDLILETETINGIKFSSGALNLSVGQHIVKLLASGNPINVDNGSLYNYVIKNTSDLTNNCSFSLNVTSDYGSFNNPATSCDAIFNEFNRPTSSTVSIIANDGLYWIGTSSSSKYKTMCDMVDATEAAEFGKEVGGYTLLWSTSEKTTTTNNWWSNGGYMSLNNGWGRNVITTENGTFNYNDFRIASNDKSRWNNKFTRFVVTENPMNPNDSSIKNLLNFNIVESSIINVSRDINAMRFANIDVIKGHYMGKETRVNKNPSGDRVTIYVNNEAIIGNAYLYSHDGYPFHYDLTSYGYYPENFLGGNVPQNVPIWDGNWPTWVAGEVEGSINNEPFGQCKISVNNSTNQFWGNKSGGTTRTMTSCTYSNGSDRMGISTTPQNGSEGRVMQWWAK